MLSSRGLKCDLLGPSSKQSMWDSCAGSHGCDSLLHCRQSSKYLYWHTWGPKHAFYHLRLIIRVNSRVDFCTAQLKTWLKFLLIIIQKWEKYFPSMSAKLVSKWAIPAGNCTAWSMVSNLTDKCLLTWLWEVATIHSTLSSLKQTLESMSQELSLLTWSPVL